MLSPKRQYPAAGLRLIGDDLAQVSLPHFERGALLRQPFVLVVNFVDVAVGMGQHGKTIVAGNTSRANPVASVRLRSCGVGRSALRLATVSASSPLSSSSSMIRPSACDRLCRASRVRSANFEAKINSGFAFWSASRCRAISAITIACASGGRGAVWALRAFMRLGGNSQCAARSSPR